MTDFTAQLQEIERKNAARLASMTPTYRREDRQDYIPGMTVTLYVNQLDADDVMFSAQSACELLGLHKNWLTQAFARPKTVEKLKHFGFSGERRLLNVTVPNSATGMTKPSTGLDRQDFNAVLDYADALGKKEAGAIKVGFMSLGLVSAAGLGDNPQDKRKIFLDAYNEAMRTSDVS
jgi:hypothetical protein